MDFAEGARRLSGLVPQMLGWPPDTFWNATPAELAAILDPHAARQPAPLTRGELDQMLERDSHDRPAR